MKKKLEQVCSFLMEHRKKIIIMRNAVIILLISTFQVLATGSYSQTTQLSMRMKGATVKEVLLEIEDQSEFYFLYNNELIDITRTVDISVKNKKVDDVLARLFDKDEVNVTINDRHIVLTPVDEIVQQQKSISGKITDESGQPLPGVTVLIKGTTNGTVTSSDGNYSLNNIPDQATLVFSFVGMRTLEITVGNQTFINITMEVDAIGIEEVVAIGYGTQSRRKVTSSISSVRDEKLNQVPSSSVATTLKGKVSGVRIYNTSGAPGSDAQITVRGGSSINKSNNPLVIIDGLPGSLNDVNSMDVESIQILKDAASTAIYGARGSNGIIIVTTKIGKQGAAKINVDFSYGLQSSSKKIDYLSTRQFLEVARPAIQNSPYANWLSINHPASAMNSNTSFWSSRFLTPGENIPGGWESMRTLLTRLKQLSMKIIIFRIKL